MADVNVAAVQVQANSTDATQDITISGFGTPKAVIFFTAFSTALSTNESHVIRSIGFTDGSAQKCASLVAENTGGASDTYRGAFNACIVYGELDGNQRRIGTLNSLITDGVRLDWMSPLGTSFPVPQPYITVILIGGADVSAKVVEHTVLDSVGSLDITDVGFQPDHVMAISADTTFVTPSVASPQHVDNGFVSYGVAARGGNQMSYGLFYADATSSNVINPCVFDDDKVYVRCNSTVRGADVSLGSFDSSGFTATIGTSDGSNPIIAFLCLAYGSNVDGFSVHEHTPPLATGIVADTAPGFKPQAAIFLGAQTSTLTDIFVSGNLSGMASLGVMAGRGTPSQGASAIRSRNAANAETGMQSAAVAINTINQTGGTGYRAAWSSWNANGFSLNYTNVPAATRRVITMTIGDYVHTATASGALGPLAASVTAQEVYRATVAASLGALTAAITAQEVYAALVTGAISGLSASVTAQEVYRTDIAGTLSGLTASVVAQSVYLATVSGAMAALVADVTAQEIYQVSVTGLLSPLSANVTAQEVSEATIAGILGALSADIAAQQVYLLTVMGVLPTPVGAATAITAGTVIACEQVLQGSYVDTTELAGSYVVATELSGSYDAETDLLGSVC